MNNYQIKQLYLNNFTKTTKHSAVNSLKSISSVEVIRDVVSCIRNVYRDIDKDIKGVLYPDTLSELCRRKSFFFPPTNIIEEINWILSYMKDEWGNITWFINKKIEFENKFLLGQYYNCNLILNEIKDKIGISLWYYEAKCLLYEYEDKRSEGLDFVSDTLLNSKENNNYLLSLLYNLYQRSQKNLSPYKFDEDLNALYKRNRTDLHKDYYKYVLFRLNYYNQYENTDLSLPIMFESLSALVDRYLILIQVIKSELVRNPNNNDIISKAIYIYKKTHDKHLNTIITLFGEKNKEYYNKQYLNMLDSYYSGKYEECYNYAKNLIIESPTCSFDAFIFYARSLIYLKRKYENPYKDNIKAPINIVCLKIYNVLTYNNVEENLYTLYQFNKNTYSFILASGLDLFYKIESNNSVNSRLHLLSLIHFDPIVSKIWENIDDALSYINDYKPQYVYSLACDVWKRRIRNESIDNLSLPLHIAEPINVKYYYNKGLYEDSFNYAQSLYNNANEYVPIRQSAVANMADCLFKLKKIQEVINLYVDYYVSDVASVAKVDTSSIIQYLQENLYEGVRRNIDLLIFVALTCKESVDKSFILLEFCEINNIKCPSELIDVLDANVIGIRKIELLFSLLNNDEILKHYSIIESFKERLTVRKKLLQYNIALNTSKKDYYQTLLKKIDDALLVYNLSKNMDESKIYANEEAIINYKLTEIDGIYNRYKLLVDTVISQRKNMYVVDFSGSSFFDNQKGYEEENNTQISINSNGLYEVFKNLYDEIKEQFLNSDYGLVAYLSTRVRHGELESMLRPEMGQRNLILQIKDNEYQNDTYWTSIYNLNESESLIINSALKQFSKTFDNAVTVLIKQKLQIYHKQNQPHGLFIYDANEKECAMKAMEIGLLLKFHNEDKIFFCQQMFKWLWEMTDKSLKNIRYYIDNTFMDEVLCAISNLENKIKYDMPDDYARTEMLAQIRSATEAIRLKIQKVSKWFNVSQPKLEDVDFKTISHLVYDTVRYSNTNCETNDLLIIKGETFMIKSKYVMHYADMLRNIISNMFSHSIDTIDGKRHFTLNITIESNIVKFNFINNISEEPVKLNKIFKEKLNDSTSTFREGGSGIAKINKILKQDLECSDNYIVMNAIEGQCVTEVVINLEKIRTL